MYKPIRFLSQRQKRNIRKQILRGVTNFSNSNISQRNDLSHATTAPQINTLPSTRASTSRSTSIANYSGENYSSLNIDQEADLKWSDGENGFISNNSDTDSDCNCSECMNSFYSTKNTNKDLFISELKQWASECNIALNHLSKLLHILKKHDIDVPVDARTVLKTPRLVTTNLIKPGEYCHLGLKSSILKDLENIPSTVKIPSLIKININIDGLPLSKSSGSQFWPILGWYIPGTFKDLFIKKPFIVGIYHGHQKPDSPNQFLKSFVDEFVELKVSGVEVKGVKVYVQINALICDAPAKSYVTCTKGHTGYHGCSKCTQEGDFFKNRMTFPETANVLRTDSSFINKIDEDHHLGVSILENLGIGMVTQIPLDYMHLVCLGVMKKLLQFWFKGRQDVRIPNLPFQELNSFYLSFKSYMTNDFARKPRSLTDSDRFKAAEFRQILLYTGVVAFRDFLSEKLYKHFLYLFCAIRILASPNMCVRLNGTAQYLLEEFIKMYGQIYGREYITHNVHNLCHLCQDVLKFGCLDNFSAFAPESYMHSIKKKVCVQSAKLLQQIVKRVSEEERTHTLGIAKPKLTTKPNYIELLFDSFCLTNVSPNNCCLLKNGVYLQISNLWEDKGECLIEGNVIAPQESFFSEPIDSSRLGIHLSKITNNKITSYSQEVICKCLLLPYKNCWVLLPLLHKTDT